MKVSVIVPVYNVSDYLPKCMESILGQTHRDLEVICIDDGSTDDGLAVLQSFAARDARVRVLHQENGGVVRARAAGLAIAAGAYVTFVDPDDWIESDMIEALLQENAIFQADIIACGRMEDAVGRSHNHPNGLPDGFYTREWLDAHPAQWFVSDNFYSWQILGGLCTKLIRRDLILAQHALVPSDVTFSEDVIAVISCICRCKGLLVVNRPFYHYVYRMQSATTVEDELPRLNFQGIYHVLLGNFAALKGGKMRLDMFLINILMQRKYSCFYSTMPLFPFEKVRENARVFVYGAGTFGRVVHSAVNKRGSLALAGWTEKHWDAPEFQHFHLEPLDTIYRSSYDVLVIAILDEALCRAIAADMIAHGIPAEKIDFVKKDVVMQARLPSWLIDETQIGRDIQKG